MLERRPERLVDDPQADVTLNGKLPAEVGLAREDHPRVLVVELGPIATGSVALGEHHASIIRQALAGGLLEARHHLAEPCELFDAMTERRAVHDGAAPAHE